MNCKKCNSYRAGNGSRKCLTCKKYIDVKLQSGRRRTVVYEVLPSVLLEQIEDIKDRPDPVQAVKLLPTTNAAIVAMRFYGGLQIHDIAALLQMSQSSVRRKLSGSLTMLRGILG